MYPELFTLNLPVLGEMNITSFGVMLALAFLSGHFVLRSELGRLGADQEMSADALLGALVGGIVGAKLYYAALYWDLTAANPFGMLFSRGGLVWYGGFLGGVLGVIWVIRRKGASIPLTADAIAPALALSYSIGRLGCFLVGDDYGRPTDSFVGIAFPGGQPPSTAGNLRRFGADVDPAIPDTEVLAVHPTQLYEFSLSLLFFFLLIRLRGHPHQKGWLFALWLVLAGAARFFVELFRAKDDRFLGSFTLAQAISVAVVVIGVTLIMRFRRPNAAVGG